MSNVHNYVSLLNSNCFKPNNLHTQVLDALLAANNNNNLLAATAHYAALQSLLQGVTLISNEQYDDTNLANCMQLLHTALQQQNNSGVSEWGSAVYYMLNVSKMLHLHCTNIISTRAISFSVANTQLPFSNNFVQLCAYKRKNKIHATVLCTGNSNEPLRIYKCFYNLQAQLAGCYTLN